MSSLRIVQNHVESLRDIRAIMNSMKSLAYMETAKLEHTVKAQRAVTGQIETAAADLLRFHPEVLPDAIVARAVTIVLGTERGFCGNLNQLLVEHLRTTGDGPQTPVPTVIGIGRKLHAALEGEIPGSVSTVLLDGAGVAEEVPDVLGRIVEAIEKLQRQQGPVAVSALYHDSLGELTERDLLPPFRDLAAREAATTHPPLLNMAPADLLVGLGDQYLFSLLFEILYGSLLNENQRRVSHLSEAVRHLDEQTTSLTHRANALRQEQITQEIEVLLLSSGGAGRMPQALRAPPVSGRPPGRPRGGQHPRDGGT